MCHLLRWPFEPGGWSVRACPHSGELLDLAEMAVLLPEKCSGQFGVIRRKALPVRVFVQTATFK